MLINHQIPSSVKTGGTNIFIGIPTYDGKPTTNCFASVSELMLLLQKMGIGSVLMFAKWNCFIDKARNTLIDEFLKTECTHIFMCDADQGFDPVEVIKMLQKGKGFVAAAVRQKCLDETYAIRVNVTPDMKCIEKDGLISTHRIGLALPLIERNVFHKLKEFHNLPLTIESGTQYTDVHIVKVRDGLWSWIGEDFDFCQKCVEAGVEIWIYPDIDITHVGPYEFKGNFHKYLCRQPGGSEHEDRIPETNIQQ